MWTAPYGNCWPPTSESVRVGALLAEDLATAPCSHFAPLQQPFPVVQGVLTLIGPRLARISPLFPVVGAALPLVGEVVTVIGRAACRLRFTSRAVGPAARLSCDPCRDLGSVVEVKLSPNPLQVALYRSLGDAEACGDHTVGQAVSDQASDLPLSRGQAHRLRSHPCRQSCAGYCLKPRLRAIRW